MTGHDNEQPFAINDRVRYRESGELGTIAGFVGRTGENAYVVFDAYGDDRPGRVIECGELERADPA